MSDVKPVAWNRYALYVGWRNDLERQKNKHGEWVKYADALATETALQAEIEALRKDARRLQDRVNYLEAITPLPKPKSTSGMPYRCTDDSLGNTPLEFDTAIAKEKQP